MLIEGDRQGAGATDKAMGVVSAAQTTRQDQNLLGNGAMKTPWEEIYKRFDPEEPVALDHPKWHVERKYSPAVALAAELTRPFGDKKYLIIGTVGSGKSTELYQLAEKRTERDFVVFVDLWQFFDLLRDPAALEHVQAWEIVFLVGLSIIRAAQERGHTWDNGRVRALEKAREAFEEPSSGASIDIAKLASSLVVLVGGTLGAMAAGPPGAAGGAVAGNAAVGAGEKIVTGLEKLLSIGQWNLKVGRRQRVVESDQDARVRGLLNAVNALIGDLQARGKRVACFIDGLDRVREPDTVKALFVESSVLGQLEGTTVLTGPLYLNQGGLRSAVRRFGVRVLANIPVLHPDRPSVVTEDGASFFREVWRVRVRGLLDDPASVIPDAHIDRLALACGGRVRQFMSMIRRVTELGYDQGDVSTDVIIARIIDDARRELEDSITKEEIDLLIEIREDLRLRDDRLTAGLLAGFRLLPYPNETEWYYPHPLLLLRALPPRKPSGSAS